MLTPPPDLDVNTVRQALVSGWDIEGIALEFLPVGFGSQHWLATHPDGRRWFVTVDDHRGGRMGMAEGESVDGLDRAFRVASAVHDRAGLTFAIGPIPATDGRAVHRIGATPWSVALFPHLDAEPLGTGGSSPVADRDGVLQLLSRLHAVPVSLAAGLARVDDLAIGRRGVLDDALADLDRPWDTGPFAERTRGLLAANAADLRQALLGHDARAAALISDRSAWVITHGEPHAANILRNAAGDLFLIDWDTVAIGPPERDLWLFDEPLGEADWSGYPVAADTGAVTVFPDAIETYRTWWDLTDISEFVASFRQPHDASETMTASWGYLQGYLPLKSEHLR